MEVNRKQGGSVIAMNAFLSRVRNGLYSRLESEHFTAQSLIRMFWPLVLDQLFIFVIGILSVAMVSSAGEEQIAAVTLVGVIGSLSYALFSAISMGGSIVIARAKGSGDPERVRRAIGQSATSCLLCGVVIAAVMVVFGGSIIRFFYPDADQTVIDAGISYMHYYAYSFIPYSFFCVVFQAFRSLGDARSSLILTIIINSVHLSASFIYINLMHLGATGSALSYLTARLIGFAFSLVWLMRPHSGVGMRFRYFFHFDKQIARDISLLGIPFSIEQILFQGGMLLVQIYLSRLSTTALAAQGIATSIFNLYYAVAYAVTAITGTVCGQCVGAKEIELARRYCLNFVYLGRYILAAAVLILFPMTPLLLRLNSASPDASRIVWMALAIGAFPMPFLWPDGYVIPTATRTAGDARFTTVISISTMFIGRLALGYLFSIQLGFGIVGVWVGQLVEWLLRAVVMRMRIRTDKWILVDRQTNEAP